MIKLFGKTKRKSAVLAGMFDKISDNILANKEEMLLIEEGRKCRERINGILKRNLKAVRAIKTRTEDGARMKAIEMAWRNTALESSFEVLIDLEIHRITKKSERDLLKQELEDLKNG